ncbi:hypothetical protein ACIGH6_02835 [Brachybacterium paraconglomeratum]
MVSVQDEAAQLGGSAEEWEVELAEERPRTATAPDGSAGEHLDAVLVLRRR